MIPNHIKEKTKESTNSDLLYNQYNGLGISRNIFDWVWEYHKDFINTLYYPSVYIFPLTPEGEVLMDLFFKEGIISYRYGAYIETSVCDIDGEIYNIVIENND